MNPWQGGPSAGQRLVSIAFGALLAAIMISLAVALIQSILPWIITAAILALVGFAARWLHRRSQGRL